VNYSKLGILLWIVIIVGDFGDGVFGVDGFI